MKKLILPVIIAFIAAAVYMISGPQCKPAKAPYYGDADALGSEEDENARYNYELMMLRDPATGKIPAHIRERELVFAANLPNDGYMPTARTTATGWQARGPWNVGGRTRALAIDVTNENIIIAGSVAGGMWRSTDKGQTWHPTTTPAQYKSVSCVVQDTRPGHTNVWYYGTGEAYGNSASETGAFYFGNGIYKSTDSGKTWAVLPSTTSSSFTTFDVWADIVWNIAIDPHDTTNSVVYAAGQGVIYKSTNGGTSWAPVLGSTGSSYFTDLAVTSKGVVYATMSTDGGAKGIYRSADGTTFTKIEPPTFPPGYNRVRIGISPMDENQVYFLGNTPGSGMPDTNFVGQIEYNSLWKYNYIAGDGTGDTGGVWRDLSANLPMAGGIFDKFTCQGSYDLVVKPKPNDTNVVFIGGTNLYRSTSGFKDNTHTTFIGGYQQGATLPVVNMFLNHHPDQHELVFFPSNPNRMLSGNDGGVFYSNDNTVPSVLWTSLNNGYVTSMFYTCAIDHASTNDIVIGGAQDNGSWFTNNTNLTTPWTTPRGGDGSYCAIADQGKAYYFSIQNGRMMRAKVNNSGVVDSFARIDPIGATGVLFINPFVLDPNNNNIMYMAGGNYLWRNSNLSGIPYARNWDSISTNWTHSANFASGTITAVAVSKVPANRVYVGFSSRKVFRIDGANTDTTHPRNITPASFPSGGSVSCIAVDPTNADNIIVTFSNYGVYSIFHSPDGGTTWEKIGGNLEQNNVTGAGDGPSLRWASIIPVPGGYVYMAATSVGLFASTQLKDTSTVWVQQGAATIGAAVVDMIDYRLTDGLVVIATHSSGMFSSHVSSLNSVKQVTKQEQSFNLANYPNPFHGETTIKFDVKERCDVAVRIYDQTGRLVQTIAEGPLDAGEHKYQFSANNLAPGMYYCNLRVGTWAETRPMLKQ